MICILTTWSITIAYYKSLFFNHRLCPIVRSKIYKGTSGQYSQTTKYFAFSIKRDSRDGGSSPGINSTAK